MQAKTVMERSSPVDGQQQTASSSSGELYLQLHKSLCFDVVKHYLNCPAVKDNIQRQKLENLQSQSNLFYYKNEGSNLQVNYVKNESLIDSTNLWTRRKQVIDNIHEMHFRKQTEYFEELNQILSTEFSDDVSKQKAVDQFTKTDLNNHWSRSFITIIQKLLFLWELQQKEFIGITDVFEVEEYVYDQIQQQIDQNKDTIEACESAQFQFQKMFATENYVSRLNAICTLQSTVSVQRIHSLIQQEMYFKRRYLVQIGGVVLNLFQENLSRLGRSIEQIDLKDKLLEKRSLSCIIPQSVAFMGICVSGNKIYISGGRKSCGQFILGEDDAEGVRSQMYRIWPSTQRVEELTAMTSARSNHGFVSYDGKVWAVGGTNGVKPICDVESYSVIGTQREWQEEPSLSRARSCAVTVVHRNEIWVIGGRDRWGTIIRDVESLRCQRNQSESSTRESVWKKRTNFPVPIMLSSGISISGRLFVVGGISGSLEKPEALNEIFLLNDNTQQWTVWAKMSHSRLNHSTASYGNYLLVVGGHTLQNMIPRPVPSAVCYDTNSVDKKEHETPPLGSNKLGLGLAMVGDFAILDMIQTGTSATNEFSSSSVFRSQSTQSNATLNAQAFMSLMGHEVRGVQNGNNQLTTP